ncbi:D-alanyl-D-alanine carboxypeptidase/D-alanyl-D-alanine-endopeptidase [Flammeovirga sp. MY04]|uniref:D-alanyl-D-alanine carboxypeptidase/D-alanyl-D-alanine endopeptidase n=1 Tax=Flammeovirga sp. MY04 TaxID=1191459 RepID=UPI0008258113|nr:D-alanyl-D-alanine carboxypeptidase/D-alanyl-D-alanine-endopeptidase [Flammeovirga sp. MY04]ANQ50084.2 D-alanyl-D-alanine carboxypeptidase/D-alanyl-D-alanine-endopeptidase [Flammeovirga sp. MY04]
MMNNYINRNIDSTKLIFFGLFFCFVQSFAQNKHQLVDKELKLLLSKEWMQGASVSFKVTSIKNKNFDYDYQSNISLTPASITKLFSTANALDKLGSNYRYETKISYSGSYQNGVLDGNLIIHGSGDPTLRLAQLDSAIAASLPDLKKITGKIVADATLYGKQTTPYKWVWEDLGNYYGAGVNSLNIDDNIYNIYLNTGNTGEKAEIVSITPKTPYLTVEADVLSGEQGTGDNSFIFSSPYSNSHIIRGTLPPNRKNFKVKGGVTDPDYHAIYMLKTTLVERGVSIGEGCIEVIYHKSKLTDLHELTSVKSIPISKIIDKTNKKSINLYAEALAKTVTIKEKNSILPDSVTKSVIDFVSSLGGSSKGIFLEDGSGLSPFGAFSASHMVDFLIGIKEKDYFEDFEKSLAKTGQSGTLKYFCRYNGAKGKILGKSGSMRRVRSYAGYIKTNNDVLVFTIIINNFSCNHKTLRKALEPLMEELSK